MIQSPENLQNIDALIVGAHPDDAELFCGGTMARIIAQGRKAVLVDLTQGERGTRGSREERTAEAIEAARILGIPRVQLDCGDTVLENSEENRRALIRIIRETRPTVVFTHDPNDRHPDHRKANLLTRDSVFYSGVGGVDTGQRPFRPRQVFSYMGNVLGGSFTPDCIVDVTPYMAKKLDALKAYKSQFFNPDYPAEETYIASARFWQTIEGRARLYGAMIDVDFGEPFLLNAPLPVSDMAALLGPAPR